MTARKDGHYGKLPEHGLSGLIANQLLRKGPQVQILYFPPWKRNPNW